MNYSGEIKVRYADLDAYGHVNHATFLTYLETARTDAFINEFNELLKQNIHLVIVSAECTYRKPIYLGDKVIVDIKTDEVRRTSFTLSYTIHDGSGNVYAEAKLLLSLMITTRRKPQKFPRS